MAGKQGSIDDFNAVGAGQTMKVESGLISADMGSPGGAEKLAPASEGPDGLHGTVRPGGAEKYSPKGNAGDGMYPRPGGSQQIKEG